MPFASHRAEDAELNTWLIVGLGNPGDDYDLTRHNVGFDAVDYLASTEKITLNKLEKNALTARNTLFGQRLILAKPMTFMNKSGSAVSRVRGLRDRHHSDDDDDDRDDAFRHGR